MAEQEIQNATIVENKIIEERTEKERTNIERTLKLWSAGIGIFLLIALFVVKGQNPDFPLKWVLLMSVIVIAICLFIFFSFNIFRMFGKEDEEKDKKTEKGLPQPASLATLRGLAEQALCNKFYANHTVGCDKEYFVHAGKNHDRIYIFITKALYTSHLKGEGKVYILINSHYPTELRSILFDCTTSELTKCINSLASAPTEDPNVQETTAFNPLTNTFINTKKVEAQKEEPKKVEEKKEDLT